MHEHDYSPSDYEHNFENALDENDFSECIQDKSVGVCGEHTVNSDSNPEVGQKG